MATYLMDTHVLLWFHESPAKIPSDVLKLIKASSSDIKVSIASIWEMAIKCQLKKLTLEMPFEVFVRDYILGFNFGIQRLEINQLIEVAKLPPHHRDPFDRLLIAQAITGNLTLLTGDAAFSSYPVLIKWE